MNKISYNCLVFGDIGGSNYDDGIIMMMVVVVLVMIVIVQLFW